MLDFRSGIHADDRLLPALVDLVPYHLQHLVGDEVFAGSVGVDDASIRFWGTSLWFRQQLLGVFGRTVAAVAKARVVVAGANARLQARVVDDVADIKANQRQQL